MLYYRLCFFASVVLTVLYFARLKSKESLYFALSFVIISIATYGQLQVASATNLEQAILANKIQYIGACFGPLLILLLILELCNFNTKKLVKFSLFLFTLFVYSGVLTIGYSDIFYKKIDIKFVDGLCILVKEYNFYHTFYYVMLGLYPAIGFIAIVYTLKNKKDISYKNVLLLLISNVTAIAAFFIGRKVTNIELYPICFDLILLTFLIISSRLVLYDVNDTAVTAMINQRNVGVISFDTRHRFLGANEIARVYYPILNNLRIDLTPDLSNEKLDDIREWITSMENDEKVKEIIPYSDGYFQVEGQHLIINDNTKAYQFILRECTDDVDHEEQLKKFAITDEMTQLLNRRAFGKEVSHIDNQGIPDDLVFISADLNGLKTTNDNYGHLAGDMIICGAASCIKEVFGNYGTVFRMGGDEYSAIIRYSQSDFSTLINELNEKTELWNNQNQYKIAISIGYVFASEYPDKDIVFLEKEAEKRMYIDKNEYYQRTGLDRRKR